MLWSPNCQLLYPFENQANDYSGYARHGTVFGSGVYATKPNGGRCLYFDGTGDYVATPSFGLSGTVVVFACWVRCAANASNQAFIGGTQDEVNGYFRCYRAGGSTRVYWEYGTGTGIGIVISPSGYFGVPSDDIWLHMGIVCDYTGKKTYIYRNAKVFYTSDTMTGAPAFPANPSAKYLGVIGPSLSSPLTAGYLQNVQLWTLATMPAAAQMLANANRLMLGMNPIW